MDAMDDVPVIVVTHRLTAAEIEGNWVSIHPDLAPIEVGAEVVLADGTEIDFDHLRDGPCGLTGPPGWLGPAAPGDLLVLRLENARTLHVDRGDHLLVPEHRGRLANALLDEFEELVSGSPRRAGPPAEYFEDLLDELLHREPDLMAWPDLPLSAALADVGLEIEGDLIGYENTDWDEVVPGEAGWDEDWYEDPDEVAAAALDGLGRRYTLSPEEAMAAVVVASSIDPLDEEATKGGVQVEPPVLAKLLASHPAMAVAVAELLLDDAGLPADDVAAFARRLQRAGRGRDRAAASWLAAAAAERLGDDGGHEREIKAALAADPDYLPALLDASWYASDRGDAGAASSLLRRAGSDPADDAWLGRLDSFAAAGPLTRGRNEPCGCGSGRKYKACCAALNGWPIDRRLVWLYDKAVAFLHRPINLERVQALAFVVGAGRDGSRYDDEDFDNEDPLFNDPLFIDLALFEDGVFARFLERRGLLLPLDEMAVARTWIGRSASIFEVREARPGDGLTLQDRISGEVLEVAERSASRALRPSEVIFTRPLPDAAGNPQLFATLLRVPAACEDELRGILDARPQPAPLRGLELATWGSKLPEAKVRPASSPSGPVRPRPDGG